MIQDPIDMFWNTFTCTYLVKGIYQKPILYEVPCWTLRCRREIRAHSGQHGSVGLISTPSSAWQWQHKRENYSDIASLKIKTKISKTIKWSEVGSCKDREREPADGPPRSRGLPECFSAASPEMREGARLVAGGRSGNEESPSLSLISVSVTGS